MKLTFNTRTRQPYLRSRLRDRGAQGWTTENGETGEH